MNRGEARQRAHGIIARRIAVVTRRDRSFFTLKKTRTAGKPAELRSLMTAREDANPPDLSLTAEVFLLAGSAHVAKFIGGPLRRRRSASCSTSAPPGTRRSIADRRTQTTRGTRAVGWLGSRFHGQASSTRQRTASGCLRAGTPRPGRRVFVHAGIKLLNRRFGRRHGFTPFYLHPKCFQFMKLCCDGCRRCDEIVHPLLVIHGTRPLCLRIRPQAKPCSVSGEFRGFRKMASSAPIVPEAQPGERLPRTPGG